jgi:hypothetical protein
MIFVRVRFVFPRSLINSVKASCCYRISGLSVSRSVPSSNVSGDGFKFSLRYGEWYSFFLM